MTGDITVLLSELFQPKSESRERIARLVDQEVRRLAKRHSVWVQTAAEDCLTSLRILGDDAGSVKKIYR